MSKALSNLLDEPEHLLASFIDALERLSGLASEDIRLLDEMSRRLMYKDAELGLDPRDTNGRELYHAAQARFAIESADFENIVGRSGQKNLDRKLGRLLKLTAQTGVLREVWSLKHSVAKDILRAHPPRSLMRQLHYRSIDSMLKHESIVGLYGALPLATSARWQSSFRKSHAKLSPLDFETRRLEVISLPSQRWQGVLPNSPTISGVAELGAVVVWPTKAAERTNLLAMLALVLQSAEKVQLLSLISKAQQGRGAYGAAVSKIWRGELPGLAKLAGHALSWQSFLHYLGRQPDYLHPIEFEPYIYPQDLHWRSVNELLSIIHPRLAWWRDGSYLLHAADKGVSLNVADVSLNHIRGAEYRQRSIGAGRQAFWDELISRYLQHPVVFEFVTQQLDENLVPGATIRVSPDEINIASLSSQAQPA